MVRSLVLGFSSSSRFPSLLSFNIALARAIRARNTVAFPPSKYTPTIPSQGGHYYLIPVLPMLVGRTGLPHCVTSG